jgi:hypothetical protein
MGEEEWRVSKIGEKIGGKIIAKDRRKKKGS